MSDEERLTGLLDRAARESRPPLRPDVQALVARGRRRMLVRRLAVAGVVAAVAGATISIALSHGGRGRVTSVPPPTLPAPTQSSTVFGVPTGDVLVFDDGYDGVATVDLDRRSVSRSVIDGQRAGDQQWRLTISEDHLIVGWGGVSAWPLTGGASVPLSPDATFSVPAAEPGDVWLVTYAGGRTGQGALTVEEVTATGTVVMPATSVDPGLGIPVAGTPGGLALQSSAGMHVWDARTHTVTRTLGIGTTQVGLPSAHRLAWCDGACSTLRITTFGGADLTVAPPAGAWAFQASLAQFSPDGRTLAVVASGPGPVDNSGGGRIVLVDTTTGAEHVVMANVYTYSHVAWTPDGTKLYIASVPDTATSATVGQYDTRRASTLIATLPLAVYGAFVALPAAEARALRATSLGPPNACGAPHVYPSNRTGTCGYRF